MKALIDTNIIVNALTSREPWKEAVEELANLQPAQARAIESIKAPVFL